jgi:hypothetical protein
MSLSQKERFKNNPVSEETKEKMAANKKGKKRKPFSEETINKMKESWKIRKGRKEMSNFLKEYEKMFNAGFKINEAPVGQPAPQAGQTPQGQQPTQPAPTGPKPLDQQAIQSKAAALTSAMMSAISQATSSTEAHQILGLAQDQIALKIKQKWPKG